MAAAMPLIGLDEPPTSPTGGGETRGDAFAVVVDAEVTSYIMGAMTGAEGSLE